MRFDSRSACRNRSDIVSGVYNYRHETNDLYFRCSVPSEPKKMMSFSMDEYRPVEVELRNFVHLTREEALSMAYALLASAQAMAERDKTPSE